MAGISILTESLDNGDALFLHHRSGVCVGRGGQEVGDESGFQVRNRPFSAGAGPVKLAKVSGSLKVRPGASFLVACV
jgi:hypothetical protein